MSMSLVEPTPAWREGFERGREDFNHERYFEAHERWEEAWRLMLGAEKVAMQGLIQIAAGLHQLQRGRPRPAASLLRKALRKLAEGSPPLDRIELKNLIRDAAAVIQSLEESGTANLGSMKL
jgi:uncharacterized protein